MKYSLWLIPSGPIYSKLKSVIDNLSKSHGNPTFEPHLTLLGDIEGEIPEITEKMQILAETTKNLDLALSEVSISTTFFQSVFVRVKTTSDLMQLNMDAKKMFNLDNTFFMPHISLFYGGSLEEREQLANQTTLGKENFRISKLILAPVTEDPKDWESLAEIDLKN